jgi:hypothetical protein
VRRGRVRGIIPWLITQRPAVLVLSQADILIAINLPTSQDRTRGRRVDRRPDRPGGGSEGILVICRVYRAAKAISKAPGYGIFERIGFPLIGTFDSSRSPRRGKRSAGRCSSPRST